MVLMNLDHSGFRKLKLIKLFSGGYTSVGGSQDMKILVQQIRNQLDKKSSLKPRKLDVRRLLAQPSIVAYIDKFISKQSDSVPSSKKNAAKSTEYRTRGNKEYVRGHNSPAVYYYTMAIINAPDVPENVDDDNVDKKKVPEELSLAYGNRSAAFYELAQYEACLADIDHSLATGYPREKQSKLLLRKVECLISMKRFGEAKHVWVQLCSTEGAEPNDERAIKIRFQLLDIGSNDYNDNNSQQSAVPSTDPLLPVLNYLTRTGRYQPSTDFSTLLSTNVEPRYSPEKGRHLVAKKDIEPGDVLLVESPFASVLSEHFEYHFCHHCCRKLESEMMMQNGTEQDQLCITGSVVPCTECTRVLYCSTGCRTEAWRTYHQFECSILPILHQMTDYGRLALRMLLITGFGVIQQVSDRNQKSPKDPLDSLKKKIIDPEDISAQYELVHQLIDQKDLIPDKKFVKFVITSAVLVQLAKKCSFVRTADQEKSAASILLRHYLQMYATGIRNDFFNFVESDMNDFATSFYPTYTSLMNHSCEPNSVSVFVQSTVLIQRAIKRIAAGSEVNDTYRGYESFSKQELAPRRDYLKKVDYFRCECSRCELEARDGLNGKYFPIGCKDCGSTLTRTSSFSDTFHCSSSTCSASMSLSEVRQLYAQIESQFATATRLIDTFEDDPDDNLSSLLSSQLRLLALSKMPGMRNCWQIGEFHRRMSDAFKEIGFQKEARQHFERYCEIHELYSGIYGAVANYYDLIDLYPEYDDADHDRTGPKYVSGHLMEHFRQIVNRMLQLVQVTLLADAEPPTDGSDDLLVDDSRSRRELHQHFVQLLGGLVEEEEDDNEDGDEDDEETLNLQSRIKEISPKF